MAPHEERVIVEKQELDEKVKKLAAFTETDLFAGLKKDDQNLLIAQLGAMELYSHCLSARIERFGEDDGL